MQLRRVERDSILKMLFALSSSHPKAQTPSIWDGVYYSLEKSCSMAAKQPREELMFVDVPGAQEGKGHDTHCKKEMEEGQQI